MSILKRKKKNKGKIQRICFLLIMPVHILLNYFVSPLNFVINDQGTKEALYICDDKVFFIPQHDKTMP